VVCHFRQREKSFLLERGIVLEELRVWCVFTEDFLDVFSNLAVH
jgi:hypothetical protein